MPRESSALRRTTAKPFDGRQPDHAASLGPANTRCVALQYLALCGVFDFNGDARTRRGNSPWIVLAPPDAPRSAAAAPRLAVDQAVRAVRAELAGLEGRKAIMSRIRCCSPTG
jgi:hypothetical protein